MLLALWVALVIVVATGANNLIDAGADLVPWRLLILRWIQGDIELTNLSSALLGVLGGAVTTVTRHLRLDMVNRSGAALFLNETV